MKKKIIAVLLCLCMAAALFPTAAFAEEPDPAKTEGYIKKVYYGRNLTNESENPINEFHVISNETYPHE